MPPQMQVYWPTLSLSDRTMQIAQVRAAVPFEVPTSLVKAADLSRAAAARSVRPPCPQWLTCKLRDPDHVDAYMHPCPAGAACALQEDSGHTAVRHHPCSCPSQDPEHLKRTGHPCPAGASCKDTSLPHAVRYHHVCSDWPCNRVNTDPVHAQRVFHRTLTNPKEQFAYAAALSLTRPQCTVPECKQVTSDSHTLQKTHKCWYGENCDMMKRGDAAHAERFIHPGQDKFAVKPGAAAAGDVSAAAAAEAKVSLPPVCPSEPMCTQLLDGAHCVQFRHVCRQGTRCVEYLKDKAHLNQFVHMCPHAVDCPLIGVALHRAQFVHLCPMQDKCPRVKEPDHAREMLHPCSDVSCVPAPKTTETDPLHRVQRRHACPAGRACKQMADGMHLMLFSHPCPQGLMCHHARPDSLMTVIPSRQPPAAAAAAATGAGAAAAAAAAAPADDGSSSLIHWVEFTHPCAKAAGCSNRDPIHRLIFDHGLSGLTLLSMEAADALPHCITDFRWSPGFRVKVNLSGVEKVGPLCGWVMAPGSKTDRTDNVMVWIDKKPLQFHKDAVQPVDPKAKLGAPWARPGIKVYKLPADKQKTMNDKMNALVDGCTKSYLDVFRAIAKSGVTALVVGGCVRDCVVGLDFHDIDMSYDCSATEMKRLLEGLQCGPVSMRTTGLVQLGATKAGKQLEGKCFFGFNGDSYLWEPYGTVSCSNADLYYELTTRDFTCNSLFYDPLNEIVVDISGSGVSDAMDLVLRIPVTRPQWDQWLDCNPTKFLRYWIFLARGYKPASQEMADYMKRKATEWFCCPGDAAGQAAHRQKVHPNVSCCWNLSKVHNCLLYMVINHDTPAGTLLKAFKAAVQETMGAKFLQDFFP